MQNRTFLFDLDGTLVDSLPGIEFSVDRALDICGLAPRTSSLRPFIGPPIRNIFAQLLPSADFQLLSRLEHAFRGSYDSEGWQKTTIAENALSTLRTLRAAGSSLFVVTNKPAQASRQILQHIGVSDLFVEILCRDSQQPAFPSKAAMLEYLLQKYALPQHECLYVGDTVEDYRASQHAGIPVAIVGFGYGEPDAKYSDCIHLSDLSQLLTIVETMEMS